ncbi:hypothetical protein CFter6_5288 [Collimonas fungivorans]|uniref:Uncharacterized protein n=1 Tax=Collimonas fungivorans TaxID=158899 RepID=A0A127PJH3_9BURK|nr:hypothetical protein CFter6_5288 [Collimonas fungivorans]
MASGSEAKTVLVNMWPNSASSLMLLDQFFGVDLSAFGIVAVIQRD